MNIWDLMLVWSLAVPAPQAPVPPGVKQIDHVHGMYVIELHPGRDLSTVMVPQVNFELPRTYVSNGTI